MAFEITRLDEIQIENLSVTALDDVAVSGLSNNDVLSYDTVSGKWVNLPVTAAAGDTYLTVADFEIIMGASVTALVGGEAVITTEQKYTKRIDFTYPTTASDVIYKGEAMVNSATSAAVWQISKTTINNVDGDVVEIWADGDALYDNIWDNRLSITYT
jgi:hypothetical protein